MQIRVCARSIWHAHRQYHPGCSAYAAQAERGDDQDCVNEDLTHTGHTLTVCGGDARRMYERRISRTAPSVTQINRNSTLPALLTLALALAAALTLTPDLRLIIDLSLTLIQKLAQEPKP